jgi:hypothetical protein
MESVDPRPDPGVDALRQLRAELRASIGALERALAAPAVDRVGAWNGSQSHWGNSPPTVSATTATEYQATG